ncbi:hypothetical protein ABW21_db0209778 [Orbilia brochopaga]|nr:hypothetical protein ABW21_db0209778 [Drechslerella brochopaga]
MSEDGAWDRSSVDPPRLSVPGQALQASPPDMKLRYPRRKEGGPATASKQQLMMQWPGQEKRLFQGTKPADRLAMAGYRSAVPEIGRKALATPGPAYGGMVSPSSSNGSVLWWSKQRRYAIIGGTPRCFCEEVGGMHDVGFGNGKSDLGIIYCI